MRVKCTLHEELEVPGSLGYNQIGYLTLSYCRNIRQLYPNERWDTTVVFYIRQLYPNFFFLVANS